MTPEVQLGNLGLPSSHALPRSSSALALDVLDGPEDENPRTCLSKKTKAFLSNCRGKVQMRRDKLEAIAELQDKITNADPKTLPLVSAPSPSRL